MAANLQQMAAAGQLMPQQPQQQQPGRPSQAQLSQLVFQSLAPRAHYQGWQTTVPIQDRMGKAVNLITSLMLAHPTAHWEKAAQHGLQFELTAFEQSQDKDQYDEKLNAKNAELFKKRQAQEVNLRETMNAQAAAHAAQQHQFIINQNQQNALLRQAQMAGRGIVPPGQQGFQHLQHPMQVSQLPQQPQQMGMNLNNSMPAHMNLNQQSFPAQLRHPSNTIIEIANLPPPDRQKVIDLGSRLQMQCPPEKKAQILQTLRSNMNPQQLLEMQAKGQDLVTWYFQQQAFSAIQRQSNGRLQRSQQQQAGMPPNTQAMQMQNSQSRPMNPAMMTPMAQNALGQPGNGFNSSNMESIINEQKAGFMAQEAGQVVVPASSGPGRNAPPQSLGGVQPQGPNQTPRPTQMQQQMFNMQQLKMEQAAQSQAHAQAQAQAQMRAQAAANAKAMQGQAGGLGGPMAASQSPAMNSLNAPMRQPPISMGQMDANQMPQGNNNNTFGQGLDPRFNQQRHQVSMPGGNTQQTPNISAMLATLPAEHVQKLHTLPQDKLNDLFLKWQQAKPQAQMQGRPGQPQLGPQFSQANLANQFAMSNGLRQQNPVIPLPLRQAYFQQQMAQHMRAGTPVSASAVRLQMAMDSVDLPPVVQNHFGNNMPTEIKNWRQLKQWLLQNPNVVSEQVKNRLTAIQFEQYEKLKAERTGMMQSQSGALPAGNAQLMISNPNQRSSMQANLQAMQAGLPQGMGITPVTPQEIQALRNAHPERFAGHSDEQMRKIIESMKVQRLKTRLAAFRNAGNVGNGMQPQSSQPGYSAAPPAASAEALAPVQNGIRQGPPQGVSQPQGSQLSISAPDVSQPVVTAGPSPAPAQNNRMAQQSKVVPANSSLASAQRSLKRPSTDDLETPAQSSTPVQRQPSQSSQRPRGPLPNLTPEQLGRLTPDQRMKYDAMLRSRQQPQSISGSADIVAHLQATSLRETNEYKKQQHPEVIIDPNERQDVAEMIVKSMRNVAKLRQILGHWFAVTKDENRLRLFYQAQATIRAQFSEPDKGPGSQLNQMFTVDRLQITQILKLLESIFVDFMGIVGKRANQANGQAAAQPTPVTTAQPPPSVPATPNEANLNKNAQTANKMHQRSNSKGGQPPAAPTSSQPPFPFGAASPDGRPVYAGKPAVTQENLHPPPPARKRVKTGNQQITSPAISSQSASPQTKVSSPEVKRQEHTKAAAKQNFLCTEPNCEMTSGFLTEEARNAHIQEEHVKPFHDPIKFAIEELGPVFGVDAEGHSAAAQPAVTPMLPTASKSQPMLREASMKRQASATGGQSGAKTSDDASKDPGSRADPGASRVDAHPAPPMQDQWAAATVDPHSLMAGLAPFDPAAGGVISDMALYRSLTPNDTPDSDTSKDTGASEPITEPTSDISEGANLDIGLQFRLYVGTPDPKPSTDPFDGSMGSLLAMDEDDTWIDELIVPEPTEDMGDCTLDSSLYNFYCG